jgi:hypothetical protein
VCADVGDPDVPVGVESQAVRAGEQPFAKGANKGAVRIEFE